MPPTSTGKGSKGGHSRSFGGCENCRRRHLKCDESKPRCLICERDGHLCAGYGKNIFFWPDDRAVADRIRRHLFTDEEQKSMSESLLAHTSQEDAVRILQEIDADGDDGSETSSTPFQVARGPFGVLRFAKSIGSPDPSSLPVPSNVDGAVAIEETMLDAFNWTGDFLMDTPSDSDLLYVLPAFSDTGSNFPDLSNPLEGWAEIEADKPAHDNQMSLSLAQPPLLNSLNAHNLNDSLPQDAPFLLNHYVDNVIGSMTPVKGSKTPWHTMFFTHAKETLATLALGKPADHASLSIFYAILSVSAFRSRTTSMSQMWQAQANTYKTKALESLKFAIRKASAVPKQFKYKTVLMALLTMIQVAIFSGAPDQAEYYLLDAEKLIRLRGLTKPKKSRRVRSLHHCYSFVRILYESTFVLPTENTQRDSVLRAIELGGTQFSDQDSPTFKLGRWSKLEETMREIKSKASGENDLHLERPGIWSESLYPNIYGLPESFLVLLSQAIRLANEKESAEQDSANAHLTWKEFWARAGSLEKCILQWQQTYSSELNWHTRAAEQNNDANNHAVLTHLLGALNHALSIYFYRRIYNLDPSMLQDKISLVRDHLLQCDQQHGGSVLYSAGFIWPAFIAACEATDHVLQASFSMWFRRCIDTSSPSFATMLQVAEQIWAGRRDGTFDGSWQEAMRKNNIRLFYL